MRHLICALASFIALTLTVHAVEVDVDRPGFDYRSFDIDQTNPGPCIKACEAEPRCRAWTYVKRGIQGPNAKCWLKSAVGEAYTSSCCISDVMGDDARTAEIREVQSLLATLGYDPGPIDGKPGRQTREAIRRFQSRYDLAPDGRIAPALIKGLWGVAYDRDLKAQSTTEETDQAAPSATEPAASTRSATPAGPQEDLSDLDSLD